ncbi:hypothetical protein [Geodermatophilus sp. URMC 64]
MKGHRLAGVALAGALLATLAGCPASRDRAEPEPADDSVPAPRSALGTEATTDLPGYGGPPAGAPASTGPLTTLRAAVDLTPATPTVFSVPVAAAPTPDGRVLVLLSPVDSSPPRLATVAPAGDSFAVASAVALPPFASVTGLQVLPDGRAAVLGELPSDDGSPGGYGVAVVDPGTRAARTTVAVPFDPEDVRAFGRSALSADARTLYLFATSIGERPAFPEQLVGIDVGSGRVVARQVLTDEIAAVSVVPAGFEAAGLVARTGGGVTLVLDASPVAARLERIPTLLAFDADLTTEGEPVRLTDLAEGAETQAVTAGADGTVFVVVEVREDVWVLAVPDGGGAGPVLAVLPDPAHDFALAVEPAQQWALLPALAGARAVNLRTGDEAGPLDLGCDGGLHVRDLRAGATGAVLAGECGPPAQRTAMLWLAGP